MTDISRHIEYLLLEHDIVCVPQLGTFRIQQTESRWVAEEDLFLPPVRNVSFSSDNLQDEADEFVRSLSIVLRITNEQALACCAEYVESMRQQLTDNSVAEVGSIGMFVRDSSSGTDCFIPCQAGVTSPAFYGLDSVYQPRLPENVRQAGMRQTQQKQHGAQADDKHLTIRIRRSILYYAATAAAAIIAFFSFSTPANYTSATDTTAATARLFMPANLLPSAEVAQVAASVKQQNDNKPQHTPQSQARQKEAHEQQQPNVTVQSTAQQPVPQAQADDEKVKSQAAAPAQKNATGDKAVAVPAIRTPEYAVVLASAVSGQNAERYVQDLCNRGIKAEMRAKGHMTRVLVPGFKSQEQAAEYAAKMRAMGAEFESVWVLAL